MATTYQEIVFKKSAVTGKVPLVSDLVYGEVAINYTDGKLYFKNSSNDIKFFEVLPDIDGNDKKYLTTNGSSLSWSEHGISVTSPNQGDVLQFNESTGNFENAALSSEHNSTSGLQGGITDEYYHFTSAEHFELVQLYTNTSSLLNGNVGIGVEVPSTRLEVSGSITATNQLVSSVETGTAPLSVVSTTNVTNLNADLLDDKHASDFALSDHNHTIDSLSNVSITSNSSGEILKWNGSSWVNNTLSEAGIATSTHNHDSTYLGINDNAVSASKLFTPRTIALSGDISGSASFDGSDNITITTTAADSGATISDDTSTDATYYPTFATATSGSLITAKISSTKLNFNPSTGEFGATSFNSLSDESLKTNIKTIPDPLSKVQSLRGVYYNWIDNNQPSIGLIAQELEPIIPEAVSTNSETGIKNVAYGNLVGLLIEAIKEQQQIIQYQEKEISEIWDVISNLTQER